jgi:acyl-CoA synthetase (AMP-forming)/AMP-acid ligase II
LRGDLAVVLRPFVRKSDEAFICRRWAQQIRTLPPFNRFSGEQFREYMHRVAAFLSPTTTTIACEPLYPDHLYGFLVAGPKDMVTSPDPVLTANQRADELHDIVSTTATTFLGLTVGCARCHEHKFDPIPQADYYREKAVFAGSEHGERPILPMEGNVVISLVPTQLQRLLSQPASVAWLRGFSVIFVGGGPAWPELLNEAAAAQLRVALSYGMTETAAMVTALRPAEFLAGLRGSGATLPHAHVSTDAGGVLRVAGDSVFRGYWPEWNDAREFLTEDLGRIDERGHVHVLGRRDAAIITGGEKVRPADVEAALRASGEFADVAVIGVPDNEWGEIVVACYPTGERTPDLVKACRTLSGPARPKRFVAVADWPRNAQGKINRVALRAAMAASGPIDGQA